MTELAAVRNYKIDKNIDAEHHNDRDPDIDVEDDITAVDIHQTNVKNNDNDNDDDNDNALTQHDRTSSVSTPVAPGSPSQTIQKRKKTKVIDSNKFISLDPDQLPLPLLKELRKFDVNNDGLIDEFELLRLLKRVRKQRIIKRRLYFTLASVAVGAVMMMFAVFGICYWAMKVAQNVSVRSPVPDPPSLSGSTSGHNQLTDANGTPMTVAQPQLPLSSNDIVFNGVHSGAGVLQGASALNEEEDVAYWNHRVHSSPLSFIDIIHSPYTDSERRSKFAALDATYSVSVYASGSSGIASYYNSNPKTYLNNLNIDLITTDASHTDHTLVVFAGSQTTSSSVLITSYTISDTGSHGYYTLQCSLLNNGSLDPNTPCTLKYYASTASAYGNVPDWVYDSITRKYDALFKSIDTCNKMDECTARSVADEECDTGDGKCIVHHRMCYSRCSAIQTPSLCGCRDHCTWQNNSADSAVAIADSVSNNANANGQCVDNKCYPVWQRLRCLPVEHGKYKCDCALLADNETSCAFNCEWSEEDKTHVFLTAPAFKGIHVPFHARLHALNPPLRQHPSSPFNTYSVTPPPQCLPYVNTTCATSSVNANGTSVINAGSGVCYSCANVPASMCDNSCYWQTTSGKLVLCSRWDKVYGVCAVSCFPADAMVNVKKSEGESVIVVPTRIEDVRLGDVVESTDLDGRMTWTNVISVPHAKNQEAALYAHFHYAYTDAVNNKHHTGVFRVTPSHLVYRASHSHTHTLLSEKQTVTSRFLGLPVPASSISVGDSLYLLHDLSESQSESDSSILVTVTSISHSVSALGAYTLYTSNSRVVVDGIVSSGYADTGVGSIEYKAVFKNVWRGITAFQGNLKGESEERSRVALEVAEKVTAFFVQYVSNSFIVTSLRNLVHFMKIQMTTTMTMSP